MKKKVQFLSLGTRKLLMGMSLLALFPNFLFALEKSESFTGLAHAGPFNPPSLFFENIEKLGDLERGDVLSKVLDVIVQGTVVDQNGSPMPGVTVSVPGTTVGTATDLDGRYSFSVPEGSILVFSFIGFETQRVEVANRSVIDVIMKEDMASLEEVVVVGYGEQKRINLTGAVSNVTSEVLESRPITTIGQGLQGTISNLNITQGNGSLGQGSSFNIRGNTSINGGGPLILVDGIPMDINLLNPSDIDNVSVLKDAASAAIYGARAAYGVIW